MAADAATIAVRKGAGSDDMVAPNSPSGVQVENNKSLHLRIEAGGARYV
jgi:hypothetical protein